MKKNEIVLFESKDGSVALPVSVESDTVWLSLSQMAQLFEKDKSVVFRHVKNAVSDGEIDPAVTSAKFAMVTPHGAIPGKTRIQTVDCYNLDVIISVGYRVKSQRGVEFRRWATSVLKKPRFLRRQQAYRRRFVPLFSEAQQVASSQRRVEAHRRPHARCAHRDDRRIQSAGKRADGESRNDVLEVMFCFPQRRRGSERSLK